MTRAIFTGTFDPMHGAHIGQLQRAYRYKPFSHVTILLAKNPIDKPHAAPWQHRFAMAQMVLEALTLPFEYELVLLSDDIPEEVRRVTDYKLIGIDSLIENIKDVTQVQFINQWPLIVLEVPGMREQDLIKALAQLSPDESKAITYEYVSIATIPMMNYDFEQGMPISRRIHSTYLRSGKDQAVMPTSVRSYIERHGLYKSVR